MLRLTTVPLSSLLRAASSTTPIVATAAAPTSCCSVPVVYRSFAAAATATQSKNTSSTTASSSSTSPSLLDALFGSDEAAAKLTPQQKAARDAARARFSSSLPAVKIGELEEKSRAAKNQRQMERMNLRVKQQHEEVVRVAASKSEHDNKIRTTPRSPYFPSWNQPLTDAEKQQHEDEQYLVSSDDESTHAAAAATIDAKQETPDDEELLAEIIEEEKREAARAAATPLWATPKPVRPLTLFRQYYDRDTGEPMIPIGPNEPRPRWSNIDDYGRAQGTGRRKASVARVWIKQGTGQVWVNKRLATEYFDRPSERANYIRPFQITNTLGQFDVWCTVNGGGKSGQAGAIRLGVSRALQNFDPGYRTVLKDHSFLQRDDRVVQSKHFGRKKARKRFQWHKR